MGVTHSSRAGVPFVRFVEPELIRYKTFDDRMIPAWFYKPAGKADDAAASDTFFITAKLPAGAITGIRLDALAERLGHRPEIVSRFGIPFGSLALSVLTC